MPRDSLRGTTRGSLLALLAVGFEYEWVGSVEMTGGPMVGPNLFPFRFDLGAHRLGERAARMQPASARDMGRCGDVVLQHDVLALDIGVIRQGGGKQGLGVRMQRI